MILKRELFSLILSVFLRDDQPSLHITYTYELFWQGCGVLRANPQYVIDQTQLPD